MPIPVTTNNRVRQLVDKAAWLFYGQLKDANGKAVLRPYGTRSVTPDPTIEFEKGENGLFHNTIINNEISYAKKVKFLFDPDGDNSQPLVCPTLNPDREPDLEYENLPTYSPSPEPSEQPAPQESAPWWQRIPVIPLPKFEPWELPI